MRSHAPLRLMAALCLVFVLALCVLPPAVEAGILGSGSRAVSQRSTDEQIYFWKKEIAQLRTKEIGPAMSKLYQSQVALAQAKKKEGFLYTRAEDKTVIRQLDEDMRRTLVEVNTLKAQETMMLAKLKPLYGVLSTQFAQEQKESIADAISTVQKLSYDNAWYSSLFSIGEAESISDVIASFVLQFVIGYIVLYPFAVLYYAVFVAPWSVYQYMSGFSDIIPAVVAYVVAVGVMCLPLLALAAGLYYAYRKLGPQLRARMEELRRQQQHPQHFHPD